VTTGPVTNADVSLPQTPCGDFLAVKDIRSIESKQMGIEITTAKSQCGRDRPTCSTTLMQIASACSVAVWVASLTAEACVLLHGEDEGTGRNFMLLEGTDASVHCI